MKYIEKLKKFGPEFFTFRIYTKLFTPIRVAIFWLLLAFIVIDFFWLKLDVSRWLPLWNLELFNSIAVKMIYLLLAIGSFTATFFTIGIEIIKDKSEARSVTYIWSNLVKYASYPFIVAGIIGATLFLRDSGVYNYLPFSIFLLFIYLTINSFYTIIKVGEILVNEAWHPERKENKEFAAKEQNQL